MALQPTNLKEAQELFSNAADERSEARMQFFEKIGLYSAGIISVSVTFVGYLLSKNSSAFLISAWGIPLYMALFVAWLLLAIAFFFAIYLRVFRARYFHLQAYIEWIKYFGKDKQDALEKIKAGQAFVKDLDGADLLAWLENADKNLKQYPTLQDKAINKKKFYDWWDSILGEIVMGCFGLGSLLTLVFVAISLIYSASH